MRNRAEDYIAKLASSRRRSGGHCLFHVLPGLCKATLISLVLLSHLGCENTDSDNSKSQPGKPINGKQLLRAYGCGTCHRIPGIRQATGRVGPSLAHFAQRAYIAGVVTNDTDNLVQWLMAPQTLSPATAMPDLAVSRSEAEAMAAYLYTLE